MSLKMFKFEGGEIVWICAENKKEAVQIFKSYYGHENWEEGLLLYGDRAVQEVSNNEEFTYYNDEQEEDKNTIGNHIKKYCKKPGIFATNDF